MHNIYYTDSDKSLDNLWNLLTGFLILGMVTDLVATPEQREQWRRNYDWDYYASKFAD